MITTPDVRSFLVDLLAELEAVEANPILLRNYEGFPIEIGNDVDIFVRIECLDEAFIRLIEMAKVHGGRIVHVHRRGYFLAVWIDFNDGEAPLHIDLYHGALKWQGIAFLRDDELIIFARRHKNGENEFMVPGKAHEAMISFLTSVLWGSFFKVKYAEKIKSLLKDFSEQEVFTESLQRVLGQYGREVAGRVIEGHGAAVVENGGAAKIRTAFFRNRLAHSPFAAVSERCHHWMGELRNYINPPGIVITCATGDHEEIADICRELTTRVGSLFGDVKLIPIAQSPVSRIWNRCKAFYLSGRNYLVVCSGAQWKVAGREFSEEIVSARTEELARAVREQLMNRPEVIVASALEQ